MDNTLLVIRVFITTCDKKSEDIDLAISRSFFDLLEETNQQRTKIRREAFHYIEEKLLPELDSILSS